LTKDYQILFAVLGLWELPLGRGSLGARIFWPPRRKFDPDEADFSDQSDTAQARAGVKVYRGRPGFLVHCRSGWLGCATRSSQCKQTKRKEPWS
jgi:hypothetical protein